jgi:hypothetical protein
MVSVGTEGAVFMWHMPDKIFERKADADLPWYE